MKITRRNFLQMLGITGVAAGGISRVWAIPDIWIEKLQYGPRIETWKMSTCGQCPAGCGIRVRLIDGIPVRILGNPISPVNSGFTCPMGDAGLELLYHPDRIRQPMRRKGKKGESSWEPISWEDALGQISQGPSRTDEEKTGRSFRVFLRRPEHAAHAIRRGFCDPHGLHQLFPLEGSGHQRTRFLAGVRGIPPPCLRPGKNRLPSHVRDKPPGGAPVPGLFQPPLREIEGKSAPNGHEDGPRGRAHVPSRQKRDGMGTDPPWEHGSPRVGNGVRDPSG